MKMAFRFLCDLYRDHYQMLDTIDDALAYCKRVVMARVQPKADQKNQEGGIHGRGFAEDLKMDTLARTLIPKELQPKSYSTQKAEPNQKVLSSVKIFWRQVGAPIWNHGEPRDAEYALKRKAEREKSGWTCFGFDCETSWWVTSAIEIMVEYEVEHGEVKIEGQPYQPTKTEKFSTEWKKVFLVEKVTDERWGTKKKVATFEDTGEAYLHTFTNGRIKIVETEVLEAG